MTIYNSNKKIIPSPMLLATVAQITLPEPTDTWMNTAMKWLGVNYAVGRRETIILKGFRKTLEDALLEAGDPEVAAIQPVFSTRNKPSPIEYK